MTAVTVRVAAVLVAEPLTSCRAPCPIQATTFARIQKLIPDPPIQLLSLSVDPEKDNPKVLAAWLKGLRAQPGVAGRRARSHFARADANILRVRDKTGGQPLDAGLSDQPQSGTDLVQP